jgi:hypothetical protein
MNAAAKLRNQCFIAAMAFGVAAGVCNAGATPGNDLLQMVFAGATSVILACFLGGFTGLYLKTTLRWLRGARLCDDEDASYGAIICGCFGAFFGVLYPFVTDQPGQAVIGVFLGALIGSAVGALPGDLFPMTMSLLEEDQAE